MPSKGAALLRGVRELAILARARALLEREAHLHLLGLRALAAHMTDFAAIVAFARRRRLAPRLAAVAAGLLTEASLLGGGALLAARLAIGEALAGEELLLAHGEDEVVAAVDKTFRSTMAGDYAMDYLKRQHGE